MVINKEEVSLYFEQDNSVSLCMMEEEQLSGRDAVFLSPLHNQVLSACSRLSLVAVLCCDLFSVVVLH